MKASCPAIDVQTYGTAQNKEDGFTHQTDGWA